MPTSHLGLRQDLQQLVIGQEVEAREGQALGLQIVVQALLQGGSCKGSKGTSSEASTREMPRKARRGPD